MSNIFRTSLLVGGPRRWLWAIAVLIALAGHAQQTELDLPPSDTLRKGSALNEVMRNGMLQGRFRLYLMGTLNDGVMSDHHAQAFGGSLGFASQRWRDLQFRMSGAFTFDLWSSDLTAPDPISGVPNRYEVGLFDVTNVRRDNQLAFLQTFLLNYTRNDGRTQLTFGKQEINSPFINPQDGRMHPGMAEGLWGTHQWRNGTQVQGGYLYRMLPRSTAGWYRVDQSIGLYPIGQDQNGRPSLYKDQQRSAGIFVASISRPLMEKWKVNSWDVFVENMFNTAMLQVERGGREDRWMWGGMAIRQDRVADGGNSVDSLAYFQHDASWVFSTRFRMNHGRFRWQANYTRITTDGRYLMPREWGRDPFYTFLPRERNEGYGGVHAATINLILHTPNGWRVQADAGYYWLPSPTDPRLNKYAFPAYRQFDVNAQYQFRGDWKGLAIQFIYLVKLPLYNEEYTPRQVANKVDMHHVDLIINYAF